MPVPHEVLLFGDQTVQVHSEIAHLSHLCARSPYLDLFFRKTRDVLQYEIAKLNRFRVGSKHNVIISTVLHCIAQLGSLVLCAEKTPKLLDPEAEAPVYVLGLCTGMLPAAAVMVTKSMTELLDVGPEMVCVALRLAAVASFRSVQLENSDDNWAVAVMNMSAFDHQKILDNIHIHDTIPASRRAYISASTETSIPKDRFNVQTHYDPSGKRRNTTLTPFGCFLERPGFFDAKFFGMPPREAAQTDPGQRLILLTTYEALEMAGYSPDSTPSNNRRRIGTFFGQTTDDWREHNNAQDIEMFYITGGIRAFGPGRLNYFFKWDGPSLSVDTACSSSMVAVQLACSALLNGECDMAVSGGANILTGSRTKGYANRTVSQNLRELSVIIPQEKKDFLPKPDGDGKRRIFTNSFNAAGGNTGMLLEDHPARSVSGEDPRRFHIVAISARSPYSLRANIKRLLKYLEEFDQTRLQDLAYSTTARRMHHGYRKACAVDSVAEVKSFLTQNIQSSEGIRQIPHSPGVVFIFTGQGSHYGGMVAQLFQTSALFRMIVLSCNDICLEGGFPCFLDLITDSSIEKDNTEYGPTRVQLALVSVEIALAYLWQAWGVMPQVVLGHSLGEYAALCFAGVLSISDMIFLLQNQSIKSKLIKVPFAFHSQQMEPVMGKFEMAAQGVYFSKPTIPIASALLGKLIEDWGTFTPEYLVKQMRQPVNFVAALEAIKLQHGTASLWLELGPDPLCLNMVRSTLKVSPALTLPSWRNTEDCWESSSRSLAAVYEAGLNVQWSDFHIQHASSLRLLALPTYAFELKNHWSVQYKDERSLQKGNAVEMRFNSQGASDDQDHATCTIRYSNVDSWEAEWAMVDYLIDGKFDQLFASVSPRDAHIILQPMIYKLFENIVTYDPRYQTMKEIAMASDTREAAATIVLPTRAKEDDGCKYSPYWLDCLAQLGGFVLNGDPNSSANDVYLSTGWKTMRIAGDLLARKAYRAYARMRATDAKDAFSGDVYLLDDVKIVAVCSGLRFSMIKRATLDLVLGASPPYIDESAELPFHHVFYSLRTESFFESAPGSKKARLNPKSTPTPTDNPSVNASQFPITEDCQSNGSRAERVDLAQTLIDVIIQETGLDESEIGPSSLLADLGVDSMLSISILNQLQERSGTVLPSSFLSDHKTIKAARDALRPDPEPRRPQRHQSEPVRFLTQTSHGFRSASVLLQGCPQPGAKALFLLPDGSGSARSYSELPELPCGIPVYGLTSPFYTCPLEYALSFEEVARLYVHEIRRLQQHGPYLLGGWSLGGIFAYEVSRQLLELGEEVRGLLTIDTPCPGTLPPLPAPTLDILENAGIFDGLSRGGRRVPLPTKQHFVASVRVLEAWAPVPITKGASIGQMMVIWARDGISDGVAEERIRASRIDETLEAAARDWLTGRRKSRGPAGWDALTAAKVDCCTVPGNRFSILKIRRLLL
ncbi:MAG: hypothetical protein Q9181_001246 [Wetmoreana brouardii]